MGFYPESTNAARNFQSDGTVQVDMCFLKRYQVTPDAESATAIAAATDISGTETTALSGTDVSDPDVPRNLKAISDNDGDDGTIVVVGTDMAGEALTENLVLNGTTAVVGTSVFAGVGTVTLPADGTGSASVGIGSVIGLPDELEFDDQVEHVLFDGTTIGTPTVAVDSGTLALNSVAMGTAGTLNGTKVLDVIYMDIAP